VPDLPAAIAFIGLITVRGVGIANTSPMSDLPAAIAFVALSGHCEDSAFSSPMPFFSAAITSVVLSGFIHFEGPAVSSPMPDLPAAIAFVALSVLNALSFGFAVSSPMPDFTAFVAPIAALDVVLLFLTAVAGPMAHLPAAEALFVELDVAVIRTVPGNVPVLAAVIAPFQRHCASASATEAAPSSAVY